jgi:hypothetical protein
MLRYEANMAAIMASRVSQAFIAILRDGNERKLMSPVIEDLPKQRAPKYRPESALDLKTLARISPFSVERHQSS